MQDPLDSLAKEERLERAQLCASNVLWLHPWDFLSLIQA